MPSTNPSTPQELRRYLGAILRREREERHGPSNKDKREFAVALGATTRTIDRLEDGDTTLGLEEYVAKYASLLLVKDPRPWWEEAVAEWKAGGLPPPPPDLPEGFAKPIRDQARRAQKARKRAAEGNPKETNERSAEPRANP